MISSHVLSNVASNALSTPSQPFRSLEMTASIRVIFVRSSAPFLAYEDACEVTYRVRLLGFSRSPQNREK